MAPLTAGQPSEQEILENQVTRDTERGGADEVAAGVVRWLIARQMPSGAIRGEKDRESPSDHYAHCFGALAMALSAESERSQETWIHAQRAVDYSLGLPRSASRKQEFNSLALLMLTECARSSVIVPETLLTTLEATIRDHSFLYDGSRLVSNNWLAMRAVCFLMRGRLIGDDGSRQRGERLLTETLGWQLDDGIFVDFPRTRRYRKQYEYATPLTYHAKMCAMLALALNTGVPDPVRSQVLTALQRGLKALLTVMSPDGDCLFYGRSCNSIFGLAACYYAFRVAAAFQPEGPWNGAATLIRPRFTDLQESDGHLRLTPALDEASRSGWDLYYHTEVYNAYAAALMLAAPHVRYEDPLQVSTETAVPECTHLKSAGLFAVRGPEFFAAFSTRGQCVVDGSSLFCDMRYSGLQPLLVAWNGSPLVPEPPLWWRGPDSKGAAVSPRRIGYTPYLAWRERDYCARIYDEVAISSGSGWHLLWGRGSAVSLSLPNRALRIVRRLRGKLTGIGDLAFTPDVLPGVTMARAILVFPHRNAILFVDGCVGDVPKGARWCAPNARILEGAEVTVRSLLSSGVGMDKADIILPTSRGNGVFYTSATRAEDEAPSNGIDAVLCSAVGVDLTVKAQGFKLYISMGEIALCLNLETGNMEPGAQR